MTDYPFDMQLVVDATSLSVVANGQVYIYDPTDTLNSAPLTLTDPNGLPLSQPLMSSNNGFIPAFQASSPQVKWVGAGFSGYFNSFEGVRVEATAARVAAEAAQASAAEAAALVGAPADPAIAAAVNGSATATRTALDARYPTITDNNSARDAVAADNAASFAGKVGKGDLLVNAADYITANGTTDDRAALLTAMGLGSVILMPRNQTIALGSKLVIPSDKTIIMNGSSFKALTESGDFVVTVASNTHIIGRLDVATATGTNVRGIQISGTNIRIDSIAAKAAAPGAGVGDVRDNGLAIASGSSDVTIGRVRIENFDYACRIESATRVTIGNYEVISYVQGVYISESKLVSIDRGHIRTASPNAVVAPGNNGVLIDALTHGGTQGVRLAGVVVEDSGEHGYRIGGSFRVSEVWHTACVARNTGASGFKALGGTVPDNNYHDGLHYTDCIAEDCGQADNNAVGFLIQYVRDSTLTAPIVRRRNKTYSAYSGIRLNNCVNVITTNPVISDTLNACYRVDPELGNNTNVRLVGGLLSSATGNGIVIDYSGIVNRRVSVTGSPQVEISGTGYCLSILNTGGGTITGAGDMEFSSTTTAANVLDTATTGFNYAGYMCNVNAGFPSTAPTFLNGSKWTERGTGLCRVKANGGWYVIDLVCTTAGRPTNCAQGQGALDTTLGKPIWLKTTPSAWIDATGATV